jgi:hypothetical protein
MAKEEEIENLLSKFSVDLPYQSDLEGHLEKDVYEALQRLSKMNPKTKEYWKLRAELCYSIASNAIEQFSRGKYNAGMLTKTHFVNIFSRLMDLEQKFGEEINFF